MEAVVYIVLAILSVSALIASAVWMGLKRQAKDLDQILQDAEREHMRLYTKHIRSIK